MSFLNFPRIAVSLLSVSILSGAWAFTPSEPGLYAVFNTSKGEFTAKLHYDKAPLTVANFVGLAEGTQIWADPLGNLHLEPYYDGLIFHRVVSEFVIQGGRPKSLTYVDDSGVEQTAKSEGPGYAFSDEIVADLLHSGQGILSMANSGINTNGSQFFVTIEGSDEAVRNLNYKHAVFGTVYEGMAVANEIGLVEVDTVEVLETGLGNPNFQKPIEDVVIHSVTIVREGEAAKAFKAKAWQLPKLIHAPIEFTASPAGVSYSFTRDKGLGYYIWEGSDFFNFGEATLLPLELDEAGVPVVDQTEVVERTLATGLQGDEKRFARVGTIIFPGGIDNEGAQFEVDFGGGLVAMTFGEDFIGTYTFDGGSTAQFGYEWFSAGNQQQLRFSAINGPMVGYPVQIYFDLRQGNSGDAIGYGPTTGENYQGPFSFTPAP